MGADTATTTAHCPAWCEYHPTDVGGTPPVHRRRVTVGRMSVEIEEAGDGTRVCVDVEGRLAPQDAHDLAAAIVVACGHLSENPAGAGF
jgi:hypothetical protein